MQSLPAAEGFDLELISIGSQLLVFRGKVAPKVLRDEFR